MKEQPTVKGEKAKKKVQKPPVKDEVERGIDEAISRQLALLAYYSSKE